MSSADMVLRAVRASSEIETPMIYRDAKTKRRGR